MPVSIVLASEGRMRMSGHVMVMTSPIMRPGWGNMSLGQTNMLPLVPEMVMLRAQLLPFGQWRSMSRAPADRCTRDMLLIFEVRRPGG